MTPLAVAWWFMALGLIAVSATFGALYMAGEKQERRGQENPTCTCWYWYCRLHYPADME